jgi:hypothetical protein
MYNNKGEKSQRLEKAYLHKQKNRKIQFRMLLLYLKTSMSTILYLYPIHPIHHINYLNGWAQWHMSVIPSYGGKYKQDDQGLGQPRHEATRLYLKNNQKKNGWSSSLSGKQPA